jgi:hypothetical protein
MQDIMTSRLPYWEKTRWIWSPTFAFGVNVVGLGRCPY